MEVSSALVLVIVVCCLFVVEEARLCKIYIVRSAGSGRGNGVSKIFRLVQDWDLEIWRFCTCRQH